MKDSTPRHAQTNNDAEKIRRYPGPRPFYDTGIDAHLFYGRDEEIAALSSRIQARRTLVLFGRSGLGKTSLIQAGLYPALRELGYLPITIRLNNPKIPLLQTVEHAIERAIKRDAVDMQIRESHSLWHLFKQTDFWLGDQLLVPLLVFDQFEEVFTLLDDPVYRATLTKELKELAGDAIPASVREARSRGEQLRFSLQPPELRLLFSLREEYVGSLETFIADIPTLLEHRYQLKPLHEKQAFEAIIQPAAYKDLDNQDQFATGPFSYNDTALQVILHQLTNRRGEIEPFQLQLICQYTETRVIEHRTEHNQPVTVDSALLGGSEALVKVRGNFYRNALNCVKGWRQKRRARKLCEGLLNAEDRRISIDEYTVKRRLKVREPTLVSLEQSRLVRKDSRPGLDGFYYELSHDSVADAVTRSRRARRIVTRTIIGLGVLAFFGSMFRLGTENVQLGQQVAIQTQAAENRLADYKQAVRQLYEESGAALPTMVRIEPGCFMMGSKAGAKDELPAHEVCFRQAFCLGRYEVTFEEYDRFAVATERTLPNDFGWGRGRRPVIDVSWYDAVAYAKWLSLMTGKRYRLPSEAEWEYLARAGMATAYWWGDDIQQAGNVWANCDGCGSEWDGKKTAPVGSFDANPFGLHDTAGNVWEWVQDCYRDNYNDAPKDGSAWEDKTCRQRVIRGGSWGSEPQRLRSAFRGGDSPGDGGIYLGFRLAQDL